MWLGTNQLNVVRYELVKCGQVRTIQMWLGTNQSNVVSYELVKCGQARTSRMRLGTNQSNVVRYELVKCGQVRTSQIWYIFCRKIDFNFSLYRHVTQCEQTYTRISPSSSSFFLSPLVPSTTVSTSHTLIPSLFSSSLFVLSCCFILNKLYAIDLCAVVVMLQAFLRKWVAQISLGPLAKIPEIVFLLSFYMQLTERYLDQATTVIFELFSK